jgi:hypothetical protein
MADPLFEKRFEFYRSDTHPPDHGRLIGICHTCDPNAPLYYKSCEYTDMTVKENNEAINLKLEMLEKQKQELKAMVRSSLDQVHNLKVSHDYKLKEIEKRMLKFEQENQELKSLVYSSLDQIDELKEHNKCLSSRVFELESLSEKKEVPNLIDF